MESIPNLVTVDLDESRRRGATADVESATSGLLDALDRAGARATFFVPRSVAESAPQLARRVVERGHEAACLTMEQPERSAPYGRPFCDELDAACSAVEQATGVRVRGHRNAALAVDYASEWTYDVLLERGLEYDSSRIPPRYVEVGYAPVPRGVHAVRRWGGTLMEIPPTTADVMATRVQLGTAATLRALPMPVWSFVVADRQARGEPLVAHLRASELGRARTVERVGRVVGRFPFTSVASALSELRRGAPIVES